MAMMPPGAPGIQPPGGAGRPRYFALLLPFSQRHRQARLDAHAFDERARCEAERRAREFERRDHELQKVRVVIQDLQGVFTRVLAGQADVRTLERSMAAEVEEVDRILARLRPGPGAPDTPCAHDAADPPPGTEVVYRIKNVWSQMKDYPHLQFPYATLPGAQQQTNDLNALLDGCRAIVFEIGTLTIPARLNDWLTGARTGYYVPFHAVFNDEVPVREDRDRILNYLSWSPRVVTNGLVDTNTGLIYRYDPRRWAQIAALLWVIVAFALCTMFVLLAGQLGKQGGFTLVLSLGGSKTNLLSFPFVESWPIAAGHEGKLLVGWLAILAGIILHLAISLAKRMQTQPTLPPVFSVEEILPRVNAFWTQIALKLLLALFAFFALLLATGNANYLNFFLAGYTLDSVVELFGATLEQRAGAQVAGLKQQLGVVPGA